MICASCGWVLGKRAVTRTDAANTCAGSSMPALIFLSIAPCSSRTSATAASKECLFGLEVVLEIMQRFAAAVVDENGSLPCGRVRVGAR